jgi:hypothetical protein
VAIPVSLVGDILELATIKELRHFVQQVICERQHLLLGAFQFDERLLEKGGKPCGLHFTMSGPRCVQFSAIWDAIRHSILFYDCTGERFQRTDLPKTSKLQVELSSMIRAETCGSTN